MFKRVSERRQAEQGFTLIELLIVIVILGILAAVVVFAVGGITDRGQTSACKSDRKTLEVAQEAYFAKYNAYTTEANLVTTKFLREQSDLYNTDATGAVTAVTPGECD